MRVQPRTNWTQAYNTLRNAGVLDGKGGLRVATYEAAVTKVLAGGRGMGHYTRARDGSWVKTDTAEPETAQVLT